MSILVAIILAVVQGFAEFLPISSSGHLAIFSSFFGLGSNSVLFAVLLHLATMLSVCVVYRKTILKLIKNPFSPLAKKIIVASFFSFVLAFLLKGVVGDIFENIALLPIFFLITAIILLVSEIISKKNVNNNKPLGYIRACQNDTHDISNAMFPTSISYKQSIIVGVVQGLAVIPGISRSGSTTAAASLQGVARDEAVDFSFLLSIPIILASALWEVINMEKGQLGSIGAAPLVIGFVVSFIVGIFAVILLKKMVKKARMWVFSAYLIFLSSVLLVLQIVVQ